MKLPTPIIRYLAGLFALVLLIASCTKPLDELAPEAGSGECTVHFALSGIEGGSSVVVPATRTSAGSASTRAAQPLAEGLTVRVTVYKYAGGVFAHTDTYVTDQAYVMRSGTLVPCIVDDRGNYISDVSGGYTLKLTGGAYNFSCFTPAVPLESKTKYNIKLYSGMDFANNMKSNVSIVGSSSTVTFDALKRHCAKVQLIIAPADPNLTVKLNPDGIGAQLSKFPENITYAHHIDRVTLPLPGTAILNFSPDEFTEYTAIHGKAYTTQTVILPTAKQNVKLTCALLTTIGGTPVRSTINAELPDQVFDTGKSYTITLLVSSTGITPTIEVEEWGADQELGVRTYPYVQNDKYIVSKDGFGSSSQALHPNWTGATPAHDELSAENALPARLEVAKEDCSPTNTGVANVSGTYTWSSAENVCSKYKQGGETGWRVPTLNELIAIYARRDELGIGKAGNRWSATRKNGTTNNVWYLHSVDGVRSGATTDYSGLRCVRDVSVSSIYPHIDGQYIVCKDDYGSMEGTFHSPWTTTPIHNRNDPANALGAIFEVSTKKHTYVSWYTAMGVYNADYNPNTDKICADGWRVPTLKEMQVMFRFQTQLGLTTTTDGFISATLFERYEETLVGFDNKTPPDLEDFGVMNDGLEVRCVRDIPRIYPYVDQGKYIVFDKMSTGSSLFTSYHPKWETTPQHEFGDPENTIYWKFEVAGADCTRANTGVAKDMDGKYAFTDAAEVCTKYNQGGVTKWRVPTFAELGVIIGFYPQIAGTLRTGTSDSYWTGTYQKISDKMLYFMGVGEMASGGSLASQMHYLRCVRDVD